MNINGYLLDTNIAIALLADEQKIIHFIQQAEKDNQPIFYSVITQCEVLSGLDSDLELQRVELFKSKKFLDVDSKIAHRAGILRRDQRIKGRKLKTPDALIIVTALEYRIAVVSRDKDMNFITDELGIPLIKL
jgi:tRNA(fMet)-specific endonuclease VapC